MSDQVTLTINETKVTVPATFTVLEAARAAGIHIPTLCFLKDINEVGACRVCLVEVEGARNLVASCVQPVHDGMKVKTHTQKVREARRSTVSLILSTHDQDCLSCARNQNCELQTLAADLGIRETSYENGNDKKAVDDSSWSVLRDPNKCILCGRCVSVCKNVQGIGILDFVNRGHNTTVEPAFGLGLKDVPCISCGQCVVNCPVAALKEKDNIDEVWAAIEDKEKHVIFQTAPAVRAALGEEFGFAMGTPVTGKMAAAIKRLGADKVYDTNFTADVTIMEEGYELLNRINNAGVLPMITSCSPGWVSYCEYFYPELLPNLSSCKSPQQMLGALAKSYYAKEKGLDPKNIYVVSVMPCVAKKSEAKREELLEDVDVVITTRELARMIKSAGIQFDQLQDEDFDADLLGETTGAAVIFGITGGVMEAAVRTVADVLEGKDLDLLEFTALRGVDGIKEASVEVAGNTYNLAVAHGTANAKKLMEMIQNKEKDYHFIEIMGCSGGCVNGGGQPYVPAFDKLGVDVRSQRAKALYTEDESAPLRKSHQNPQVKKLYDDFLGEPNSHLAHELLHTHYHQRQKFNLGE
ncbi:MAG: NADH-dependent [FeFe] hydrogenase, group A6 [Turicibacter sp.]|nr:NADH-dependent [FeFe] hydrogenase, group A6 [Turicibacter sp.]